MIVEKGKKNALSDLRKHLDCGAFTRLDTHLGFLVEHCHEVPRLEEKPLLKLKKRLLSLKEKEKKREVLRLSLNALKIFANSENFPDSVDRNLIKTLCEREEKRLQDSNHPVHNNAVFLVIKDLLPKWYWSVSK